MVTSVLPALLIEVAMYLAPGFAPVRERMAALGSRLTPALVASALVPYLMASLSLGSFRFDSLAILAVLSLIAASWYRLAPAKLASDLAFLALMAAVFLSRLFPNVYDNPAGKPALDILGRMMWIRLGVAAMLVVRGVDGVDFGFLPRRRDWTTGLLYYLLSVPLILPLAWWTGFVPRPVIAFSGKTALVALATFLGMLWVVALAEEFFFRGLLQQWLSRSTGSPILGLAMASLLFGAAHLPFRDFPNWRFALLATIAGVFYGLAYARNTSIRASMVTHALVNTTWRVLFG